MKHVRVRLGNPRKPVATLSFSGRSRKQAVAKARRFLRTRMKNISEGFYRDGTYHPIRSAVDYSPARAGEGRKAKYSKRPKARMRRARAPRRGAIS